MQQQGKMQSGSSGGQRGGVRNTGGLGKLGFKRIDVRSERSNPVGVDCGHHAVAFVTIEVGRREVQASHRRNLVRERPIGAPITGR